MYRTYSADEYRQHLGLDRDLTVDCFLAYGTYRTAPYEQIRTTLDHLELPYEPLPALGHDLLRTIHPYRIEGRTLWFSTVYGGAHLSELLHLACLFGSRKNLLMGSCGGLKRGASNTDLVVPRSTYANESSARAYAPDAQDVYHPHPELVARLRARLSRRHTVHVGPTVTHQSMMAETWEMVEGWSAAGYVGVEMEAATVFAVSAHFGVPAAAALRISDNLIEQETVFNATADARARREQVTGDLWRVVLSEVLDLA